jgi:hypothetical protein
MHVVKLCFPCTGRRSARACPKRLHNNGVRSVALPIILFQLTQRRSPGCLGSSDPSVRGTLGHGSARGCTACAPRPRLRGMDIGCVVVCALCAMPSNSTRAAARRCRSCCCCCGALRRADLPHERDDDSLHQCPVPQMHSAARTDLAECSRSRLRERGYRERGDDVMQRLRRGAKIGVTARHSPAVLSATAI